jgi:hypothetical protein
MVGYFVETMIVLKKQEGINYKDIFSISTMLNN